MISIATTEHVIDPVVRATHCRNRAREVERDVGPMTIVTALLILAVILNGPAFLLLLAIGQSLVLAYTVRIAMLWHSLGRDWDAIAQRRF